MFHARNHVLPMKECLVNPHRKKTPVKRATKIALAPHYSGPRSLDCWRRVRATTSRTTYEAFCALQELEARALQLLADMERQEAR